MVRSAPHIPTLVLCDGAGVLAVVLVFGNRVISRPGDYMNQTLNYFEVQHTE